MLRFYKVSIAPNDCIYKRTRFFLEFNALIGYTEDVNKLRKGQSNDSEKAKKKEDAMSVRGIHTDVTDMREKIFTEVARLAYEGGDYSRLEELPYKIVPGELASFRESVFTERAIVGERLRLAIGLPNRTLAEHAPVADGVNESAITERYYEPPLINIIKFACHKCLDNQTVVTNMCQGCTAHPCEEVCPKGAVVVKQGGKSKIDPEKCINCGRCRDACPYGAIVKMERPCAKACGMHAIHSDEYGRADINYDKCVSCGMCLVNCPFGAIADKGQIFQTILAMKAGTRVYAAVAPAFIGQFGPKLTPERFRAAMKELGFADVVEVAAGADLCTIQEAKDFLDEVPEKIPFMGTSCCPSWSVMAKTEFPKYANCISMALTPMVFTGRMIKKADPGCKVAFIGPCAAKKLEASRRSVRSDVDFVLTFEEVMGMFEAKGVSFDDIQAGDPLHHASGDGRNFAVAGGVANAVVNAIHQIDPDREVNVVCAQGLDECRKMMQMAKAGKYNGYLLEGMACPGGCVGGAGTIQPIKKSAANVAMNKKNAPFPSATQSEYKQMLEFLEERDAKAPAVEAADAVEQEKKPE